MANTVIREVKTVRLEDGVISVPGHVQGTEVWVYVEPQMKGISMAMRIEIKKSIVTTTDMRYICQELSRICDEMEVGCD